ncbi:alpha/beta fold hydrolase [Nonomuraea guangzhouensis]|uniref:Alpha/beta fold hydrolase n=1 Tax=Nonomuraea guangzhouensis TaxID=1291555 RepID=A0ABW4GC23_9ACTN|nr:alpha/beta hydrolase [Nonomuraea guangzhouensis]
MPTKPTAGADRFTTLNGLRAHYVEWGEPDAPPIVLLHGLRSYARTWEAVAAALADRHRLIALDHRGRGDSAWDPAGEYVTDAYVSDLEQLVDALDLRRFTLVGHSMGGTNAIVYAARRPERVRLALIEDIGPGSSASGAGAERIRRELERTPRAFAGRDEARAYWRSVRPDVSQAALDSRVDNTVHAAADGTWVWKFDVEGIARARLDPEPGRSVDLWPHVEALRCPTLVLRGARSDFLPAETCAEMAARQPLITWEEIPEAGHYVHDDNPAGYLAVLLRFLDRHRGLL